MALALRTDQRMPDCLRRSQVLTNHPQVFYPVRQF
jgi:hypothetical protein